MGLMIHTDKTKCDFKKNDDNGWFLQDDQDDQDDEALGNWLFFFKNCGGVAIEL